jgi:hypothetical protein
MYVDGIKSPPMLFGEDQNGRNNIICNVEIIREQTWPMENQILPPTSSVRIVE